MSAEVTEFVPADPRLLLRGSWRVTAANPGMMTGPGTNTYLLGTDELAVIDPGPDDDATSTRWPLPAPGRSVGSS